MDYPVSYDYAPYAYEKVTFKGLSQSFLDILYSDYLYLRDNNERFNVHIGEVPQLYHVRLIRTINDPKLTYHFLIEFPRIAHIFPHFTFHKNEYQHMLANPEFQNQYTIYIPANELRGPRYTIYMANQQTNQNNHITNDPYKNTNFQAGTGGRYKVKTRTMRNKKQKRKTRRNKRSH
jgi:hypothetical protein